MKILELGLQAFGPFRNRVLDFTAGGQGLHVVFGRNEAGKSSALRALRALLYGIPVQTTDAFIHPYDGLRLTGRLRLSTGEEIEFVRRKVNKGSLQAPDGTRLDDHALDRFLGGVGVDQFRLFWGIDHQRLVEGGREILEGKGDLSESLFAAGSGISNLNSLRKRLDAESELLFAQRAKNPRINKALTQVRELRGAQREATISAEEWGRQETALQEAQGRLTDLSESATRLAREFSRLERVKRVLPLFAEHREVGSRIQALAGTVILASDFSQRRQQTEADLRMAEQKRDGLAKDVRVEEEVLLKLGPAPGLLAEAEVIANLHQRLGEHRKALRDRPGLLGRSNEQRSLAGRLLRELRPTQDLESAEELRVLTGRRARIQKLAAEQERLDERCKNAERALREAAQQFERLSEEALKLPAERDLEGLASIIEEVRQRGDFAAETARLELAAKRDEHACEEAIAKLGIAKPLADKRSTLRVPTAGAIAQFEREAQRFNDEAHAESTERQRLERKARELDAKIDTLRTKKAVPTEEDLAAARKRRDKAFALLREHWEKGRDVSSEAHGLFGSGDLLDLYPSLVETADEVADRLRSEADRVAELAQFLEDRLHLGAEVEALKVSAGQREEKAAQHHSAWQDAWKEVLPVPPAIFDGRAWREDLDRLMARAQTLSETRQRQAELQSWVDKWTKSLSDVVTEMAGAVPQGGLPTLLVTAMKLRQRVDKEQLVRGEHGRHKQEAEEAACRAKTASSDAKADLQSWQKKWAEAVSGLVLGEGTGPDDALLALELAEKTIRAIDEAKGYDVRIAGIDRDADTFRSDVAALAGRLGEHASLEDGAEDFWVEGVHARLAAAVAQDSQRRDANNRLQRLRSDLAEVKDRILAVQAALSGLREEAQCGDRNDFAALEGRSSELVRLRAESIRLEQEILRHGDGASLAELEAEACAADKDAIDAQLGQIAVQRSEVEKESSEVRDPLAMAKAEMQRLQGPSVASEKAELVQSTLAQLREDVLGYARLRVAATLLTRRMEDYRRANQAPLLQGAGEIFRTLTLGAFERLEADVDDSNSHPLLVGVRPDGKRVATDGMSEGTVDQVFLALRLAAVETSCASGEPMPFVVDDILVQFDDERSAAALAVLAKFATKTQVVLFTHHGRVREHAEGLASTSEVFVHSL